MAAADQNYRLGDIALPDMQISGNTVAEIVQYLHELNQAIVARDTEIKNKINQLHIEYTETIPSDAPDEPEPVFKIYRDNGNYYLYTYIDGAWKYTTII